MEHLLLLFDGIHLEGGVPMALFYALFGFVFVFLGITLLVIILSITGALMSSKKKKKTANKEGAAEKAAPVQPSQEEGTSPETVALISAAIAAYLTEEGQKCDFVVRRIKRL